jgi:urease accessory protein
MKRVALMTAVLTMMSLLASLGWGDRGRDALAAGLLDPVLGLDHFMVLLGVGLWAGQWGGTAQWALPAAYLLGTPLGFVLAAGQPPFPLIDTLVHVLILGSLLLIAGALVVPLRLPMREAAGTVAMFGGCHGYVHRLEAVSDVPLLQGLGVMSASAVLLVLGVGLVQALPKPG